MAETNALRTKSTHPIQAIDDFVRLNKENTLDKVTDACLHMGNDTSPAETINANGQHDCVTCHIGAGYGLRRPTPVCTDSARKRRLRDGVLNGSFTSAVADTGVTSH